MRFSFFRRQSIAFVLATLSLGWMGVSREPLVWAQAAKPAADPIDFEKARELFQKRARGGKLTPDEEAYVQRAMEARRRMNPGSSGGPAPRESTGLVPLCDLSADEKYQGQEGGLYGGGRNTPPDKHRAAAERELAQIQPLDANGKSDPAGKIVFISISMSNATQEYSRFKRVADLDPAKSSLVTIVDCAQGGQAMAEWAPADARPWTVAEQQLANARCTPQQVQVAWVKLANKGPRGKLEEHGRILQRDSLAVLQNARQKFPHLRIVYLASRIYGGYAASGLNPEPYAYESAFVARWLIQDQMNGKPELNFDAERGAVRAPLLLWGPYLWADGVKGRKSDDLVWKRDDLAGDGTHPSREGELKVAQLLLNFCKTDPLAKGWFTGTR